MNHATTFRKAQTLQASGKLQEAEQVYNDLAGHAEVREAALAELVQLYLRASKPKNALGVLSALVAEHPNNLAYCDEMAQLLSSFGQIDAAIQLYGGFIERQPELAEAHYNLALFFKKRRSLADAMASYERSVELGISRVHEVYANMGVLASDMRRAADARRYFEAALARKPDYVPALFNLAAQYEETGERQQATDLYHRVLELEPGNREALARLAYAKRVASQDDVIIGQLRDAIAADDSDPAGIESLRFALGKALDDVGEYQAAFAAYAEANEIGRSRHSAYDREAMERSIDEIIDCCDAGWIDRHASSLPDSPIFICGMFRSGSTLTEQILGRHEHITAGGELDILPGLLAREMSPYPGKMRAATAQDVERLASAYLGRRAELFGDISNITDKRPDNHLRLGLIKAMFPAARIVYTTRDIRDNCLSVYFQQLDGSLSYATDLANTAHYYRQQERLLQHWTACFGDSIAVVRYEELVSEPRPVLAGLLEFLGLDWDDRCLDFQAAENPVKTASVWQVREKLHTASAGRWRNYAFALEGVEGFSG